MIKLKSLLKEELEPTDSNQWEDWYQYIDYFEYDIEKDEIIKLQKKFNLHAKAYFNNQIIKIGDDKHTVYLEYDKGNETADLIKDIEQWVYDLNDIMPLGIDSDKLYNGNIGASLEDLRKHPGKVYHYTTEEKFEEIKEDGQLIGSYGTGINNRSAHGIFTSVDPEEYADGIYGDICLEIDLESFKTSSGLPELSLSFEPEVEEYITREYIRAVLEIEHSEELPSDMSPNTIIVHHNIPLTYVNQI